MVRTRFAPSPTGYLHVGGLRTALFAWLVAKQANGQFILRIEDTDRTRHLETSVEHIMDSLRWLGLNWDEGPDKKGPFGPYRQSQRLAIYKEWGQKLIAKGRAYADPYSPKELELLRQKAIAEKKPFLFRAHRPANPPSWDGSQPLRFKSEPKSYRWQDEVMGELSAGPEAVDDFILIKTDGYPTYNFAHIVDDYLMQITYVIRSQEFLPSVPKYLNLYEALEIKQPKLATLPYVMAPDGKTKLSKRHGAKDILDYKRQGYLPEALINFLATLGWNDGTDQEIFNVDELIKKFSLNRVQKSGAKFDEQRLTWMNGYYIRKMSPDELLHRADGFWPPSALGSEINYRREVIKLVQDRLKYLAELPELTDFFFNDAFVLDRRLLISAAQNLKDPKEILKAVKEKLADSNFTSCDLEKRLRSMLSELGVRAGDLFGLIRIAVTGKKEAPGLWETLAVLNKKRVMDRLQRAIELLN
jgi:glutamyl-tRNA synthetase